MNASGGASTDPASEPEGPDGPAGPDDPESPVEPSTGPGRTDRPSGRTAGPAHDGLLLLLLLLPLAHSHLHGVTEPAHHDTSPSDTSRPDITTQTTRAPHERSDTNRRLN